MARSRGPRAAGGAPLLAVRLVLLSAHGAVALPAEDALARFAADALDGYFAVGPERVGVLADSHPFEAGEVLSHQQLWDWHAERVDATPARSAGEQQQVGVAAADAAGPRSRAAATLVAVLLLALLDALRFTRARRSPGTAT